MKEIIAILDKHDPTYSYYLVREIARLAQVPLTETGGVIQDLLDELRS